MAVEREEREEMEEDALVDDGAEDVRGERQSERFLAAPALLEPAVLEAALAVFSCALVATIY